ncbi:MAG: hypothetical protein GYA33_10290 [Thermogutta sp.]|nr:hypothetical protein [Thermogutta sp.]
MRKLLVLSSLVVIVVGTAGCQRCNWFRRGALFAPMQPAAVVECPPVVTDVPVLDSSCEACAPPAMVVPPTTTYVPGPAG